MKTRSQSRELEVNIDFDEASAAWMENKKKTKNGCCIYTCEHICKNGNKCKQESLKNIFLCRRHAIYGQR